MAFTLLLVGEQKEGAHFARVRRHEWHQRQGLLLHAEGQHTAAAMAGDFEVPDQDDDNGIGDGGGGAVVVMTKMILNYVIHFAVPFCCGFCVSPTQANSICLCSPMPWA